jgi:hypothetical protein
VVARQLPVAALVVCAKAVSELGSGSDLGLDSGFGFGSGSVSSEPEVEVARLEMKRAGRVAQS